jgi:hypothetical protein
VNKSKKEEKMAMLDSTDNNQQDIAFIGQKPGFNGGPTLISTQNNMNNMRSEL